MYSNAFLLVVAFALELGVTHAAPAKRCPVKTRTTTTTCDMQICADYIDPCGQMYGGCFLAPECGGTWPTFTPPPGCTITPVPTIDTYPTPTPTCDATICVDGINECGVPFGGCYLAPECGGTAPTFTTPPCTTTTPTPTPCSMSICVDNINECGIMFGGCFLAPECGGTWPSFTTPPCPSATPYEPDPYPYPTKCQLTSTICTDRYNPCEPHNIGTCFLNPECGGTTLQPVNTVCSTTTTADVYTTTTEAGGYEKVKRVVEWYTWTTTIPEVTPTVDWDYGL